MIRRFASLATTATVWAASFAGPALAQSGKPTEDGQAELTRRVQAGANPAADAHQAVREGRLGVIMQLGDRVPVAYPLALTCFTPNGQPPHSWFAFGGVITLDPVYDFAVKYNQALISDPANPDRELCRPSTSGDYADAGHDRLGWLASAATMVTEPPTDLHAAARRGTAPQLEALMRSADLNAVDAFGMSPLAWAVARDRREAAEVLLRAGAHPLDKDAPRLNPTYLAVRLGRDELLDLLLRAQGSERMTSWPRGYLEAAVRSGKPSMVRRIATEPHEASSQVFAAYERPSQEVLDILLQAKEPQVANDLLAAAIREGDLRMVRLALAHGADPNSGDGETVLGQALWGRAGYPDIVQALIAAGADVNQGVDPHYPTHDKPIHAWLRRFGISVGADPLDRHRKREILAQLIAAGADMRVTNAHGEPLVIVAIFGSGRPHMLAQWGNSVPADVVETLSHAGMDVNARWQGRTALDYVEAVAGSDAEMAGVLRSLGARRND